MAVFYSPQFTSDTGGRADSESRWKEINVEEESKSKISKEEIRTYRADLNELSKRTKEIDDDFASLGKQTKEIKDDISKSEEHINRGMNFMMFVAIAIIVAVFVMIVPIFLDYYKNNLENHKKYLDEISKLTLEIEKNKINQGQIETNNKELAEQVKIIQNKINCAHDKKFYQLEQCFK